ncbi:MAG: dihydropteroate synthase [Candidatus Latescibacteria bacterium]|jgi:5-methyltetrahydrofolate corrinoid/iron sulfur protein methyltransferase|nr:dihydropteroate synthase [Candidatus Latescibacterota bacterium]MBT5832245.1 dihydropteroate synthase [Candidatus Latescibacterota bacterium]
MGKTPTIIGELMNHSYARARRAWEKRNIAGYQKLAKLQTDLGASYLTLNLDGTQTLNVEIDEMLSFLPELVPALQDVTSLPISFDNPNIAFHKEALKHFDTSKSTGKPILNSLAVSRDDLTEMIELVAQYETLVIVMVSECYDESGKMTATTTPEQARDTACHFAQRLKIEAGVENDRIIIDPGLSPITSDFKGHINLGLDTMKLIRATPELEGVHISLGLSNLAFGTPKEVRHDLERAYLTLALEAGIDWVLANPEKNTVPLDPSHPMVIKLQHVLNEGRPKPGETIDTAGYRQLEALMGIWKS